SHPLCFTLFPYPTLFRSTVALRCRPVHGSRMCTCRLPTYTFMQAFLVSTGVVALAEIGDKTQLLAFVLAARFRRPWPIIAGILCATLLNHGLAGALGSWITSMVQPS